MNTHPALLPAFPGAHGVRDALAHGVKVTGSTVILVDDGVDTGPIVAQRAVDVRDGDDEATLHERIKVVERELLVEVVDRMAHRRLDASRAGSVRLRLSRPISSADVTHAPQQTALTPTTGDRAGPDPPGPGLGLRQDRPGGAGARAARGRGRAGLHRLDGRRGSPPPASR